MADIASGLYFPVPIIGEIFSLLADQRVGNMRRLIPMAVLNVIGSIQNLESAEAAVINSIRAHRAGQWHQAWWVSFFAIHRAGRSTSVIPLEGDGRASRLS